MPARCSNGEACVNYRALGEPAKLASHNLGSMCFACEKHQAADMARQTKGRAESARSPKRRVGPPIVPIAAPSQDAAKYVTPKQAAEMLGVGASAIRERIRSGRLPAEKHPRGRRGGWRIPLDALLRADGAPGYSALILTELLAQRVAAFLGHDQDEHFKTLCDLREKLGEEQAKREMAERELKRLTTELAELRTQRAGEKPLV